MQIISHFAKNSMRKSYRTSIPLHVMIDSHTYSALDWSLTGLALQKPDIDIDPGDTIKAVLVLQMHEAAVSIPLFLHLEYIENERFGFSFVDLSEKNKNVLRRFIELAIEGKIDKIDDIIAIYEEPQISSPIHSPVTLQDEEAKALKVSFFRASLKYLLFAIAVLALFAFLIFYNMRYSYEGSGVVAGNDIKIYPSVNAIVEKLYAYEGQVVQKDDPLIQLESSDIKYKLALLEAEKKKKIEIYNRDKDNFKNNIPDNKKLIQLLKQKVSKAKKTLQSAKAQYVQHLITRTILTELENSYLDANMKLENAKMQDQIIRKKLASKLPKNLVIDDINVKLDYLKKKLKSYRINAPVDAKVYEIYVSEGQEATKSNPIMLLWTDNEPYIVANVPNQFLSVISVGTKVDIIDKSDNRSFQGTVTKTGSINESLENETFTLFIQPDEKQYTLKPHQRLQVLFKRDF